MGKWKQTLIDLEVDVANRLNDFEDAPESCSQSILKMIDRYITKTEKRFDELDEQHKTALDRVTQAYGTTQRSLQLANAAVSAANVQAGAAHAERDVAVAAADRANAALADGLANAADARRELYKLLDNPTGATTLGELVEQVVARGVKPLKAIGPGLTWYDESSAVQAAHSILCGDNAVPMKPVGAIDPKEITHSAGHVERVQQLGKGYSLPVWGADSHLADAVRYGFSRTYCAATEVLKPRTLLDAIDREVRLSPKVVPHKHIFDHVLHWGIGKPGDAEAVRAEMLKRGYSRHVRDDGTSIYVLDATDGLKRRIAERVLEEMKDFTSREVRADFAVREFARRVPDGDNWWGSKFSYFGLDAAGYDHVPNSVCTWRKRDR